MKKIITAVSELIISARYGNKNLIIAIEGRCASGKSTLAFELQKRFDCNVIHMDEFFLRNEQRNEIRLQLPGENIDHERFLEEVLIPLKAVQEFSYRPYNCKTGCFIKPVIVQPKKINIIEGVYSCHRSLAEFYNLKIFLTVSQEEQMRRIIRRDGEQMAAVFKNKWIPMEESYFAAFDVKGQCDYIFDSSRI